MDFDNPEPTERDSEMSKEIDDFTIFVPEFTDLATCGLKTYDGLDRLWRMVERYKMTVPIAIRVVDNKARCVRAIRCARDQTKGWQLEDEIPVGPQPPEAEIEFPLTMNSQDAKGNLLKMRLQVGC